MADNFDIFNNVLNEFQKLDGGGARKQVIKALQAMDKSLSELESATRTPPSKTRSKRTAGNGRPQSGSPSTRLPPRQWRKTAKNAAPAPHRLPLPRPQPLAKSRSMHDREPGRRHRIAGSRVCFCSDHGSVVSAMKACDASSRGGTISRRACSPPCLSDASAHDHALQMLAIEESPAGDCAGENTPAMPPAHWPDVTLAETGRQPLVQHAASLFQRPRQGASRPSSFAAPRPVNSAEISDAVDCVREAIPSRFCDAVNPVFGPPRPAHRPLKSARHTPQIAFSALQPNSAARRNPHANGGNSPHAHSPLFFTSSPPTPRIWPLPASPRKHRRQLQAPCAYSGRPS